MSKISSTSSRLRPRRQLRAGIEASMLNLDWKRNKFKARRKMSNSSEPGKEDWNQDNLANSPISPFSSRQSKKKRRFMAVKSQGAQTLLGRLNLTRRRIR